jgi:hypothetical protein
MNRETFGSEDDQTVVLVLGWGNRIRHENVQWLIDAIVDDGYQVHCFELPVVITDFDREYLEPVASFVEELDSFRFVGHSTGCLIGAYIDGATTTTYLSPWWGFPAELDGTLLSLVTKLPIARPVIPSGTASRDEIGALATDRQLEEGPDRAAPTFLREAKRAQEQRPPIDDDAVVFCTLRDQIVSVRAIGEAVTSDRVRLYDGGHELFSSPSRAAHLDALLSVVAAGPEGLDQ